jgi:hypothetical protein
VTVDVSLAALARISSDQRKAKWRRLFGTPAPPAFGAGLLSRAIAHAIQEEVAGGADKALQRRLAQLNNRVDEKVNQLRPSLMPGTWLSRTWHGQTYQVIVLESGYEYAGTRYASLSAIARLITGAEWSGPRFFGLYSPRLRKVGVLPDG